MTMPMRLDDLPCPLIAAVLDAVRLVREHERGVMGWEFAFSRT